MPALIMTIGTPALSAAEAERENARIRAIGISQIAGENGLTRDQAEQQFSEAQIVDAAKKVDAVISSLAAFYAAK